MSVTRQHDLFSAKVLKDSVSPEGARLFSAELTFPRFILPEFNTHRVLSKNSASSRAIPVKKQLEKVLDIPYIPERIGVNQSGMQASRYLEGKQLAIAQANMYRKRDRAIIGALEDLVGQTYVCNAFGAANYERILVNGFNDSTDRAIFAKIITYYDSMVSRMKNDSMFRAPEEFLNIHKQTLNRYLEPFLMHTVVVSGTEFDNLFALRIHADAQDEINIPVSMLKEIYEESTPDLVNYGEWHLPFIQEDEEAQAKADPDYWKWISAGRCARTSYETHNGTRDLNKDYELAADRLNPHGHMSPFEHPATPLENPNEFSGNFKGWKQMRKTLPYESNYAEKLKAMRTK